MHFLVSVCLSRSQSERKGVKVILSLNMQIPFFPFKAAVIRPEKRSRLFDFFDSEIAPAMDPAGRGGSLGKGRGSF